MKKQTLLSLATIMFYLISSGLFFVSSNPIESPSYKVIHSGPDFEVRLYKESSWMSAPVQQTPISFENSTQQGFHRLYKYLHGSNQASTQIAMTSPVLTSITHGSRHFIKLYLSSTFRGNPPLPNSELNLKLEKWKSHCIGVRKFSGFAKDDNVNKEVEALTNSMNKFMSGKGAALNSDYSIAQYNASHHLSGRLNEVWVNVSGLVSEGCLP